MADGIQARGNSMGQYKQLTHNAAVAQQNAGVAREEAKRARQEAGLAEEAHRRVIREELGAAFTAAAQSGARGEGGTTADRQLNQESTLAELDALNIRYGGELKAGAALTDAANYDFEAQMAKKSAATIKKNLAGGTLGGMLTSASSYGTSAQNNRLRAAERNAREPRYTYGNKNVRNKKPSTYRPSDYGAPSAPKPRSNYSGPGSGAKG